MLDVDKLRERVKLQLRVAGLNDDVRCANTRWTVTGDDCEAELEKVKAEMKELAARRALLAEAERELAEHEALHGPTPSPGSPPADPGAKIFVVVSFDYCRSSDVKIHGVTRDEKDALATFLAVEAATRPLGTNSDSAKTLVEVVAMDEGRCDLDGQTLYWPRLTHQVLASNNM